MSQKRKLHFPLPIVISHVQMAWKRNGKSESVSFSFRLIIFLVLFVDHVIIGVAYNVYGYSLNEVRNSPEPELHHKRNKNVCVLFFGEGFLLILLLHLKLVDLCMVGRNAANIRRFDS